MRRTDGRLARFGHIARGVSEPEQVAHLSFVTSVEKTDAMN